MRRNRRGPHEGVEGDEPVNEAAAVVGGIGATDPQTHNVLHAYLKAGIGGAVRLVEDQRAVHGAPELLEI